MEEGIKEEEFVKKINIFNCDICDFNCSKKGDYNRHITTRKHQLLNNTNNITSINIIPYTCDNCNKTYKHASSLWNHKQKCEYIKTIIDDDVVFDKNLVMKILNQNNEFKELLIEQTNLIKELIEKK